MMGGVSWSTWRGESVSVFAFNPGNGQHPNDLRHSLLISVWAKEKETSREGTNK
jgi:hypothetical protein